MFVFFSGAQVRIISLPYAYLWNDSFSGLSVRRGKLAIEYLAGVTVVFNLKY